MSIYSIYYEQKRFSYYFNIEKVSIIIAMNQR